MINFLRYRAACVMFSISLISACAVSYLYRGYAFNYSVDFTGGTQTLLKFNKKVGQQQLEPIFKQKGWNGIVMREFSDQEILVRVKEYSNDAKGLSQQMVQVIEQELPDVQVTVESTESVGESVGKDLYANSMKAVLLALILMLLYIAFRFRSFAFAAGAVVALAHDALVMLSVFMLFDRAISVNVIGAILAVLGYSINDTIVIFSQIRDNLKKMHGQPLETIVNTSLNQTLRRTILTSLSTGLTVMSMFLLGGEALRDFSLTLLVGIIFGTYSSVYVASPVMMMLYKDSKK